jgi:hypothetical protein
MGAIFLKRFKGPARTITATRPVAANGESMPALVTSNQQDEPKSMDQGNPQKVANGR